MKKDEKRHRNIKIMICMMVTILLLLVFYFFLGYNITDTIKQTKEEVSDTIIENRYDRIYLYIEELYKEGKSNVSVPKKNIENGIKENFTEKDFEKNYKNMTFDSKLYNLIRENIQGVTLNGIKNSRNGVLVLSNYGVVEDYNYNRSRNKNPRYFTTEMNNTYNKNLYKDAIDKIKNHSDGIICIEDEAPSTDKSHIKISEANYDTLKEVYLKEGLEGLSNYQFFVPLYITDTGDIFGKPDIENGERQDNYKFIIIQEFNLIDQINNNHSEIKNLDEINSIEKGFNNSIILLKLLEIFHVIITIIVVFVFIMMYNNFIFGYLNFYDNSKRNNDKNESKKI